MPLTPVRLYALEAIVLFSFSFLFRALVWSGYTILHWYRWLAIGRCTASVRFCTVL